MAKYNSENILVGAAAIFVNSDEDAALPDYGGGESAADSFLDEDGSSVDGWTSTGYTTGGVEVTYTPDFGEVEVDQLLDAAVMYKQRMTVTVGTTLAEATLENLIFAWGQGDETLNKDTRTLTITAGALGDRPVERQLAFVGQAPVGEATGNQRSERVYHLHRCLNVESSAFSLARADATTIPVSLRCLPNDDGQYGIITDRTYTPGSTTDP